MLGWRTCVLATVAIVQIHAVPPLHAQAPNLADTAKKSIVYIHFDVTDPNDGSKSTIQGTGFVVTENGYVLTASHLFQAWRKQTHIYKNSNFIQGTLRDKPGYVTENQLKLDIVDAGDPDAEDVALLKLPDQGRQAYPTAAICSSKAAAAKTGDQLTAYGFPNDQNFQPVTVRLGTQNAPGGRWAAASDFTEGMSGGPVYSSEGFVVGLVKGGLDNTTAVRWITPIQHANNFLTKAGFAEQCSVSLQDFKANNGTPGPAEIRRVADRMVRLCLGGGHTESRSGGGGSGADLSRVA
jgi:S1-C subfamily serine protease